VDPAHTIAAAAANGYPVLRCQECADNIRATLTAAGFQGQIVELRTADRSPFMICLSYDGGQKSITLNGWHVGVRVGDLVFDNLHTSGMPYDAWVQDFDGKRGVVVAAVTDF
jgi:hypothetical protein